VAAEVVGKKKFRLYGKVGRNICSRSYGMGNIERASNEPIGF
jgi:hypothetical protein